MRALILLAVLGCASAYGQDSSTAAQTAGPSCQLSSQGQRNATKVRMTHRPTFSIEPGRLTAGTMVSMRSSTPNAVIYYTTEDWIPSTYSTRYTGPIPILATTHLQAIAVAPGQGQSLIARANYIVDGPPLPRPDAVLIAGGVLHAGTSLPLVTNSEVTSQTAQAGDRISVLLDEDLKANGTVLAARGTPVEATIITATKPGPYGVFGVLGFQVHSLTIRGTTIPLLGTGYLMGPTSKREFLLGSIPFVDLAAGRIYGNDAVIKPGMVLTARVAEDTPLPF